MSLFTITTMFLSILRLLQSFQSRLLSPLSLWPRRPETLGCVLLTMSTMFIRFSPVETFDYADVSGYFGPGAFGAWVITCLAGFCPAEGRHLLRLIWKESYHIPHQIDSFTRLEYPRDDCKENYASRKGRYFENSQLEVVELNSGKMKCLRRFLEYTLQATMNEGDDPPTALREFLYGIQSNDREIRALQKENADNFLLQAKCAELVLDSLPMFSKRDSLKYPGFIQYGFDEDENRISEQSCEQLVESLASTFTWFEMSRTDFTQCLLRFRNGVQFWFYQTTQSEAEIGHKLDPNTWAAIIYPIVACWVCIAKRITSNIETWRPEDDAAACVAQFAIGVSSIALLGSRYRIIRANRSFRLRQRSWAWMIVFWHSCAVLLFRLRHISESSSSSSIAVSAFLIFAILLLRPIEIAIYMLLLAFEMVTPLQLGLSRTSHSFSKCFCPECLCLVCVKGNERRFREFTELIISLDTGWMQVWVTNFLPFIALIAGFGDAESYNRIIRIQWSTRLHLLIPGSSANISDLDQAAALATALALALVVPLGTLASCIRAHWVRHRSAHISPRLEGNC
ncbi:hypothetical protein BDV24DRAFT_132333 [Aspergillus arachidicola]|uniref:Integral membrane protein n=1 Tax=Aspergillus arachidicola TaxID=656916 RepID=A0A5N6YA82_9EURO|nr:hypothetical protein BDV24DRAFT_132333 [Aspergillus arachidicola]